MSERPVRTTSDFIDDVDRQYPDERGPDGEPSRSDFSTYDMFAIRDRLAEHWSNESPLIPGRSDYRVVIVAGRLGIIYSVEAQLAPDQVIELLSLEVDAAPLPEPEAGD